MESSQSNTYAAAPTPTLEGFLEAVCDYEPHRLCEDCGYVLVEIRIGVWSVMVPFSEIYGVRDKLRLRS